ncbi:hypothetical protein LPB072_03685 [Hydrogenophaga crassostreae]|nr:hypothetical protein LPB072_03685 [Hydrogenophaga crassostreae]
MRRGERIACDHIESGAKSLSSMAPFGPAWHDIAIGYKCQADAQKRLTTTVLAGSAPMPATGETRTEWPSRQPMLKNG